MNKGFQTRWRAENVDEVLANVALSPRLTSLIESRLVRKAGALVLHRLATPSVDPAAFQDRTGYEAFINKFHVEDFLDSDTASHRQLLRDMIRQGMKAAVVLAGRLQAKGRYRVLLSLDAEVPAMTLRFFERRHAEAWGPEDPEGYGSEEVLMIDT